MKKITILSATSGKNFLLSKQLENILKNLEVSVKIVNLEKFEDGISPGQACVFYNEDKFGLKVLGGGWIKN